MNKEVDVYKIYRQLEERKKRANPYSFYDKDELIDEILKNEDELERYKNIVEEIQTELFDIKDMIYKPETREENTLIQRKISEVIKKLEELKGE